MYFWVKILKFLCSVNKCSNQLQKIPMHKRHIFWVLSDNSEGTTRDPGRSFWCLSSILKCSSPSISQTFHCCMLRRQNSPGPLLKFWSFAVPRSMGRIADAIVKILLSRGVEALLKWVDNFNFFQYLKSRKQNRIYEYAYTDEIVWTMAEELKWPWAPMKFKPFDHAFLYIRFFWNVTKKQVLLSKAKKEKYIKKLSLGC